MHTPSRPISRSLTGVDLGRRARAPGLGASLLLLAACGPTPTPAAKADKPAAAAPPVADDGTQAGAAATPTEAAPAKTGIVDVASLIRGDERHFAGLKQLTFGGENAEAYFSSDESRLIFQSTREGRGCDQIYSLDLADGETALLSTGKGRTTCSYYLPGDQKILYASTHAAADDCLPAPDRSHGYVWKLYDEFDIYVAGADGSDPKILTKSPGYDAEATVSPKGDRIVFTSTRDGDPEIYTMAVDGSDVKRLTTAPGYDGGAFFSADGSKIIYRANHPEGDDELAKYQEIRKEGLVRPTRLELFIMDGDGGDQRQITRNGKANFGPFFHPDGQRVIFASNMNDPIGRNFDLYMIGVDGEGLEQITFEDSFDGFPMFSRDGKRLVFASNRGGTARGETNIFLAEWRD